MSQDDQLRSARYSSIAAGAAAALAAAAQFAPSPAGDPPATKGRKDKKENMDRKDKDKDKVGKLTKRKKLEADTVVARTLARRDSANPDDTSSSSDGEVGEAEAAAP